MHQYTQWRDDIIAYVAKNVGDAEAMLLRADGYVEQVEEADTIRAKVNALSERLEQLVHDLRN